MEFDPLARDIAPPRHEIESDSEDENDDNNRGVNTQIKKNSKDTFTPPKVEVVDFSPQERNITHLTVLLSRSGEALSQTHGWSEAGKVHINGDQHGSLAWTSSEASSLLLLLRPSIKLLSEQANFAYISNLVLSTLQPSNAILVDDYNPQLYIPTDDKGKAPIRRVSSQSSSDSYSSTAPFESPNYILGLAAAMMVEASILDIPATLLMLPQATNLHLQSWSRLHADSSSLDTKPEPLDDELTASISTLLSLQVPSAPLKQGSRSVTAFLDERRTQSRRNLGQGISGMYV